MLWRTLAGGITISDGGLTSKSPVPAAVASPFALAMVMTCGDLESRVRKVIQRASRAWTSWPNLAAGGKSFTVRVS